MAHIRDPIHGAIELAPAELALVDSAQYQRLRNVKQLGFAELAFPGASHSRYAHGLGAMAVATRIFDTLFPLGRSALPAGERARFRQALRAAVLFHDLGHPPMSHTSERVLPPAAALGLPEWVDSAPGRQATHEDMTLKLLLDSDLARLVESGLGREGIGPSDVAALICGRNPGDPLTPSASRGARFAAGGVDYGPVLRQIVSSEIDADRMDYLLRDSFYTGANYGRYDLDWLAQNLVAVEEGGRVHLGIRSRAIFAFEDFLLSRYHMFLSVYYHRTPICFDRMLGFYYAEARGEYTLPADAAAYLEHDDITLISALRRSTNRWAQLIVRRQPYKLVAERNDFDPGSDLSGLKSALEAAGVEYFFAVSEGELSKYFGKEGGDPIYVVVPPRGRPVRIEDYTPLYKRYAGAIRLMRVYCRPSDEERARAVADGVFGIAD